MVACHSGTQIRSIITPEPRIIVFVDGVDAIDLPVTNTVASGQPGIGVFNVAGSISEVDIGPYDSVAPQAMVQSTVDVSPVQTYLAMRWQPQLDDANGTGIWRYDILRADQGNQFNYLATTTVPSFIDYTVSPSSSYRYQAERVCADAERLYLGGGRGG